MLLETGNFGVEGSAEVDFVFSELLKLVVLLGCEDLDLEEELVILELDKADVTLEELLVA